MRQEGLFSRLRLNSKKTPPRSQCVSLVKHWWNVYINKTVSLLDRQIAALSCPRVKVPLRAQFGVLLVPELIPVRPMGVVVLLPESAITSMAVRNNPKDVSLGAWRQGALMVVGTGLIGMAIPLLPCTPATPRRSSQKDWASGTGRTLIFYLEFT